VIKQDGERRYLRAAEEFFTSKSHGSKEYREDVRQQLAVGIGGLR
jgi:hypothetical protein